MENLIGIKETAKILRIGHLTLYKRLRDGTVKIPCSKIGKIYKFRREDVEKYFKDSFKPLGDHESEEEK